MERRQFLKGFVSAAVALAPTDLFAQQQRTRTPLEDAKFLYNRITDSVIGESPRRDLEDVAKDIRDMKQAMKEAGLDYAKDVDLEKIIGLPDISLLDGASSQIIMVRKIIAFREYVSSVETLNNEVSRKPAGREPLDVLEAAGIKKKPPPFDF